MNPVLHVVTSLKTLIRRMNESISCSWPVIASIPGSILFKNESRSFKVVETWDKTKLD